MTIYYDRYNRSTKKWKGLKFVPGRVVQLPELNEMQSVAHDNFKQISDVLFKDGSIVAGLQLIPDANNVNNRIVTAGQVYAYGYIIDAPQGTVTIANLSEEKIGIKLTETVVTENEDVEQNDPVEGAKNQGRPGAHRLTYVPTYTVNDDDAFTLHILRFGELVTNNIPPQFDELNKTLAIRTYDESGSYLVNGMNARVEDSTLDYVLQFRSTQLDDLALTVGILREPLEDDVTLAGRVVAESMLTVVEAGLAYVSGFRIEKPSPTRVLIPKSKTERFVNGEIKSLPAVHVAGTAVDLFVSDLPVSRLGEVTASIRKTFANVVRSNVTSGDFLPTAGPVIGAPASVTYTDISSVVHTYSLGTHYTFASNTITWIDPDNIDPNVTVPRGASYIVVLDYNATLTVGDDNTADVYLFDGPTGTVRLTGKIAGYNVQYTPNGFSSIDYYWYLNRSDLIYMDKDGKIDVILGQSDRNPVVKGVPSGAFGIAQVALVANQNAAATQVTDVKIRRLTMTDLNDLVKRLERAEYNQAITNLNVTARLGVANNINLKGIFTDAFSNVDKLDTNHADYIANKIGFNFTEGFITPGEDRTEAIPAFTTVGSTGYKEGPRFLTSATAGGIYDTSRMSQLDATSTVQINQYSAFSMGATMTVSPDADIATSNNSVVLGSAGSGSITVTTGSLSADEINRQRFSAAQNITMSDSTRFARSRVVTISAAGFPAFADNLAVTMDQIAISATPTGTTTVGAQPFNGKTTVKADSTGKVTATFTIPANTIISGVRTVRLSNGTVTAETTYTATNVVNTSLTFLPAVTFVNPVPRNADPVAQTFSFGTANGGAALVAGIDLYFSAKPTTGDTQANRLIVQIRRTTAGIPDSEKVLASKDVMPSDVNISNNGTVATRVIFDDSVLCEKDVEYSVVLLSISNQYYVYKATLGESTIGANPRVISEQAHGGVLLTSANGSTWTPDQFSDLKFALLCTNTPSTTILRFDNVTFPYTVNQLQLLARQLEVPGSTVVWQYSTDAFATDINSIDHTGVVNIMRASASVISLRAVISNSGTFVSSQIEKLSVTLLGIRNKPTGVYVSKAIQLLQTPANIKIQLDVKVPAGTTFQLEYGLQDGFGAITWYPTSISGSPAVTNEPGYSTYTYDSGVISTAHTIVRVRTTLTSNVSGADIISSPRARRLVAIVS